MRFSGRTPWPIQRGRAPGTAGDRAAPRLPPAPRPRQRPDRRNRWARAGDAARATPGGRSEEHTSEIQSRPHLVCRLLLVKKTNCLMTHNTRGMSLSSIVPMPSLVWNMSNDSEYQRYVVNILVPTSIWLHLHLRNFWPYSS